VVPAEGETKPPPANPNPDTPPPPVPPDGKKEIKDPFKTGGGSP
jgi:hypothetical protein